MKNRFLISLALLAVVTASCNRRIKGNNNYITETRNATGFTKVISAGDFDVFLTSDPVGSVKIYAESNILPHIETDVDGDELTIRYNTTGVRYEHHGIKVYVPAAGLVAADLQGSGSILAQDTLNATSFYSNISGSGNVSLVYTGNQITTNISGSGDFELTGQANSGYYTISGSGSTKAFGMLLHGCNVNISGSGNAYVYADSTLNATISGSGDITYMGNPPVVQTNVSGSGNVHPF